MDQKVIEIHDPVHELVLEDIQKRLYITFILLIY
jgi:hypothetical protein